MLAFSHPGSPLYHPPAICLRTLHSDLITRLAFRLSSTANIQLKSYWSTQRGTHVKPSEHIGFSVLNNIASKLFQFWEQGWHLSITLQLLLYIWCLRNRIKLLAFYFFLSFHTFHSCAVNNLQNWILVNHSLSDKSTREAENKAENKKWAHRCL